jgi:hypothetical protein
MKPKFALIGLLALGAVGLVPQLASAFPNGLMHADQVSNLEQVSWVCNPWGRCWWRPNYYRSSADTTLHRSSSIPIGAGAIVVGTGGRP